MSISQQANWFKVQQDLIEKDLIAEFEVETITYTRIGGYKATPFSYDLYLLNKNIAKSLKGVWRWWARVAITGAYNGSIDYSQANKYLNEIFGGTVGERKGLSLYQMEVKLKEEESDMKSKLEKWNNYVDKIDDIYEKMKQFMIHIKETGITKNVNVTCSLNPSAMCIDIKAKGRLPPTQFEEEAKKIKEEADKIFSKYLDGYEMDKKKKKQQARIKLKLDDELYNFAQIPRIKLLLMPRKDKEDDELGGKNTDKEILAYLNRIKEELFTLVTEGMRLTIKIYGNKDKNKANFAISTFILALILGGFGSLTKRGFGSLKILNYKINDEVKNEEIVNIINNLKDKSQINKENLENILNKLIKLSIDFTRNLFKIKPFDKVGIPNVPSLVSNTDFFKIKVMEVKGSKKVNEILKKVGDAFLKQEWKVEKKFKSNGKFHTWILGLPRYVGETGYLIKEKGKLTGNIRRISSIAVRLYENSNRFFLILYGFLSRDWPINKYDKYEELYHKNGFGNEQQVKNIKIMHPITGKIVPASADDFLKKVFDVAFDTISYKISKI
jgi:CRISPR type III-B/RAMP module RAMP protein Cmr1